MNLLIKKALIGLAKKAVKDFTDCEKQIFIKPKGIPITININDCVAMGVDWLTEVAKKVKR